jgi:uncharacterized protein YuzE
LSIQIGGWDFDQIVYDGEADVLYLSMGPPQGGYGEETPEGHFLRFNEQGRFYGVTLVDAQRLWNDLGEIVVTVPTQEHVEFLDHTAVFASA